MKFKEELSITETWDDLILLDRKYGGTLSNEKHSVDKALVEIERNATLKLRLWMRQSSNEKHSDIRDPSKNKEV